MTWYRIQSCQSGREEESSQVLVSNQKNVHICLRILSFYQHRFPHPVSIFSFCSVRLGVSSGPTPSLGRASLQQQGHCPMPSCKLLSECPRAGWVLWLLLSPGSRRMQAGGCTLASCLAETHGGSEAQVGSLCCCSACSPILPTRQQYVAENHYAVPASSWCQPQAWHGIGKPSLCSGILHAWIKSATAALPINYQKS